MAAKKAAMDRSKPKSAQNPPPGRRDDAAARDRRAADNPTGRVKFDDRGNAIWEWSITTGAFSPELSTQRMKRLENTALTVAEDAPTPFSPVKVNPLGTAKGYDPYDSGKLMKTSERPRKKDLRKLSEWVAMRKMAEKKGGKDD
jgi:hypothetical protein